MSGQLMRTRYAQARLRKHAELKQKRERIALLDEAIYLLESVEIDPYALQRGQMIELGRSSQLILKAWYSPRKEYWIVRFHLYAQSNDPDFITMMVDVTKRIGLRVIPINKPRMVEGGAHFTQAGDHTTALVRELRPSAHYRLKVDREYINLDE